MREKRANGGDERVQSRVNIPFDARFAQEHSCVSAGDVRMRVAEVRDMTVMTATPPVEARRRKERFPSEDLLRLGTSRWFFEEEVKRLSLEAFIGKCQRVCFHLRSSSEGYVSLVIIGDTVGTRHQSLEYGAGVGEVMDTPNDGKLAIYSESGGYFLCFWVSPSR